MMKMGWKAGQGLGKQEQGITTPLMARKTDKRAGVIVNAPEKKPGGPNNQPPLLPQQQQMQQQAPVQGSLPKGTPTKVVLLRNMVSAAGSSVAESTVLYALLVHHTMEMHPVSCLLCLMYGRVAATMVLRTMYSLLDWR